MIINVLDAQQARAFFNQLENIAGNPSGQRAQYTEKWKDDYPLYPPCLDSPTHWPEIDTTTGSAQAMGRISPPGPSTGST